MVRPCDRNLWVTWQAGRLAVDVLLNGVLATQAARDGGGGRRNGAAVLSRQQKRATAPRAEPEPALYVLYQKIDQRKRRWL